MHSEGTSETEDTALMADNFIPSQYIRNRLQNVKTGDETRNLKILRSEMSALNNASQDVLKNNVFQNYQQFIDASKEISALEKEIYELSSLLTDQKQLIENLVLMTGDDKISINTQSSHSTTSNTNPIQFLMQKIDGVSGILNNLRTNDRVILHGEMMLLDGETKQPLEKNILVLLTDRLLIGSPSGSGKYSLESTFSLNNVAAVNVKDRESRGAAATEQILKLLIFPEQRYYRCESARLKKIWLDEVEQAKRSMLHEGSLVRQATIRGKRRTVHDRTRRSDIPLLPECAEDVRKGQADNDEDLAWLEELPAEVDDCIAHRDMDRAVELLVEWKQCKTKSAAVDAQLSLRKSQVIQLLSEDVRRPGAVHGGPRAMKKARILLTALGRGTYALDLYLRRRSALQRAAIKEIAISEEPLSYVKHLCQMYCQSVQDVVGEFNSQSQAFAQVLRWCSQELSVLLSLVRRHVIEVAPTIAVLSHTWRILMRTMGQLTEIGAELRFEVDRLLEHPLTLALNTNFANIMDGIKLRMTEERWRPMVAESESALARLIEELSDVGLSVDWTMASKDTLNLSSHVIGFSRASHTLSRDFAPFHDSPFFPVCEKHCIHMWLDYLEHLTASICDSTVFAYSATFILTQVLPLCEQIMWGEGADDISSLLPGRFPKLVPYAKEDSDEEEEVAHV